MRRRFQLWLEDYSRWALALILFGLAGAGSVMVVRSQPRADELGNWLLTVAVFLVAVATWMVTIPRPADIWIDRNIRKAETDLIFFLVDHPRQGRVPRDALLHYELALANVGGRKTVLSDLSLDWFLDSQGQVIKPCEMGLPLQGHMVRSTFVWRDHRDPITGSVGLESFGQREQQPLPLVLEPDDAVVVRFRTRIGIDWSPRWIGTGAMEPVHDFSESLRAQIARAHITVTFRRGRNIASKPFVLPITVAQQDEYQKRLEAVTQGYVKFPDIEEQKFPKE